MIYICYNVYIIIYKQAIISHLKTELGEDCQPLLPAVHPIQAEDDTRRWPTVELDLSVGCATDQPIKIRSGGDAEKKAFCLFFQLSKNSCLCLLNFLHQTLKVAFNLT